MLNAKLVGCGMGMGFAPTWLRQVSPPPPALLHVTTLTTALQMLILMVLTISDAIRITVN